MKFDMPECGGCRTCEIACSYHHTGGFAPALSSIKILNKEHDAGYSVLFLEEDGEGGKACDLCIGLDVPYCVEFCKKDEELKGMLKELSGSKSKGTAAKANGPAAGRDIDRLSGEMSRA